MNAWLRVAAGLALAILFFFLAALFRRIPDPFFAGRYASEWAHDLPSGDYKTRSDAQSALQMLGEASAPQIRVMLRKENPPWDGFLERLNGVVPGFKYRSYDATLGKQRAAEMAGLLGANGKAAVPDLIRLLANDQTNVEAERALVRIGSDSVPSLELALQDRNIDVRRRSAALLGEIGQLSKTSIAALIAANHDKAPIVRKEIAVTLARAKPPDDRVMAALLAAAQDLAPEVRAAAFASFGILGRVTADISNALRKGISDPAPGVQLQAAKALWHIEGNESLAVPVLVGVQGTSEGWDAAYALGEIGPRAASAIPALAKILRTERVPRAFRTPPSSAYALGRIGEAAIPTLTSVLTDPDASSRLSAVLAFGFMGRKAAPAAPKLLTLLKDRDADVRHAAALTLPGIGAKSEDIVDALSDCLQADDIYMRFTAAEVLREIAPNRHWVGSSE